MPSTIRGRWTLCDGAGVNMKNSEKQEYKPTVEDAYFYIMCPCKCGRAFPIEYSPHSSDIPEFGNKVWKALVGEKGHEGAIEFLHEKVDSLGLD